MIGAMSGGLGVGKAGGSLFPKRLQNVNGSSALTNLAGSLGASGIAQTTAAISAPGQILSDLQQLQAQNPMKFQQVVGQITSQLQTASQKAQGAQRNILSNLAGQFQNIAAGGSLAQLQPQQQHHHSRAHQAYSQNSQNLIQGLAGLAASSTSLAGNSPTQKLLTTISTEVKNALGGK
jgi:hypothetical protein